MPLYSAGLICKITYAHAGIHQYMMLFVAEEPITARVDPAVMNIYERISRARKLIKALCRSSLCCHRAHLNGQMSPFLPWMLARHQFVVRDPSVAAAELIKGDGSG